MTQPIYDEIVGNLTADPEVKTINGREMTRRRYNRTIDGMEEYTFTTDDRELRSFWLAINAQDEDGNDLEPIFWSVADWDGYCRDLRKGDFVALTGFAEIREGEWEGKPRTFRNFKVKRTAKVLHAKNAEAA